MREFKDFDTMEKELKEKRGVISAFDFANEAVAIAIVAIDVATGTRNKELADAFAAMKLDEAVSKLFPEEPQDEKEDKAAEEPQEEKNTEKDAKFEDLKKRIFYRSAECGVPIPGTVESNRTAEIKRHAKHEVLLSLIFNAGLTEEYRNWLWENGYE